MVRVKMFTCCPLDYRKKRFFGEGVTPSTFRETLNNYAEKKVSIASRRTAVGSLSVFRTCDGNSV
jgi:hypothetical protein